MKKLFTVLPKKVTARAMTLSVRGGWFPAAVALHKLDQVLSRSPIEQLFIPFCSVASEAARMAAEQRTVLSSRVTTIGPLRRLGRSLHADAIEDRQHSAVLPEVGITVFRDVAVIGGSEMLLTSSGSLVYDELATGDPNRYGGKAYGIIPTQSFGSYLPACRDGRVVVRYHPDDQAYLPRAIHLCKDHSSNYYHWLLECLPRAILALEDPRFAGYPLLVDAGLPEQCLEALRTVSGTREIVPVRRRTALRVGELIFPGGLSVTHDNYGFPVAANDFVIAPEAVGLVRSRLLPKARASTGRRLYISRRGAQYRRLLNEEHIEARLLAAGFEVVRPGTLSFAQQLELFSGASAIVGPTGAGMTNIVFAPPACRIIVLAGETNRANHFVFGQFDRLLDAEMIYVTGTATRPRQLHSDYRIDLSDLDQALAQLGLSAA